MGGTAICMLDSLGVCVYDTVKPALWSKAWTSFAVSCTKSCAKCAGYEWLFNGVGVGGVALFGPQWRPQATSNSISLSSHAVADAR
jgi:hypothetical protein